MAFGQGYRGAFEDGENRALGVLEDSESADAWNVGSGHQYAASEGLGLGHRCIHVVGVEVH